MISGIERTAIRNWIFGNRNLCPFDSLSWTLFQIEELPCQRICKVHFPKSDPCPCNSYRKTIIVNRFKLLLET